MSETSNTTVVGAQTGETVCNTWDAFLMAMEATAAYRQRAARPMPPETWSHLGNLLQRMHDASWYGTLGDIYAAAHELAPVLAEWQPQLAVPVEDVNVGDYIRAIGIRPYGSVDAVSGVVVGYRDVQQHSRYGFQVKLRTPAPKGRHQETWELFVAEGDPVTRLPRPGRRRARPAWLGPVKS